MSELDLTFIDEATPRHGVRNERLFAELVTSLGAEGWTGRPLLAFERGGEKVLLTGSHRYAAAREAGVLVPVLLIPETEIRDLTVRFLGEIMPAAAALALARDNDALIEILGALAEGAGHDVEQVFYPVAGGGQSKRHHSFFFCQVLFVACAGNHNVINIDDIQDEQEGKA